MLHPEVDLEQAAHKLTAYDGGGRISAPTQQHCHWPRGLVVTGPAEAPQTMQPLQPHTTIPKKGKQRRNPSIQSYVCYETIPCFKMEQNPNLASFRPVA